MEGKGRKAAFISCSLCYPVDMEAHASGLWQQRRPLQATNMSDLVDEASAASPHGCDNGALTDRFGVLIQGLLAVVAFSTLMCKSAVERIGTKKEEEGVFRTAFR